MEGPLDLRLNPQKGKKRGRAFEGGNQRRAVGMLVENADEPYAEEITKEVIKRRRGKGIVTTTDLKETIAAALSFLPEKDRKDMVKKSCQRVFQALRIDVNSEFEVLYEFLEKFLMCWRRADGQPFSRSTPRRPSGKKILQRILQRRALQRHFHGGHPAFRRGMQFNSRACSTKMRWAVRAEE